jgi:hypothetical protein
MKLSIKAPYTQISHLDGPKSQATIPASNKPVIIAKILFTIKGYRYKN